MPAKTAQSKPIPRRVFSAEDCSRRRVAARFDVAQRTEENAKLWQGVDSLSSAAANSPGVRKTIRERARYEIANNSYAAGIVATKANDIIGPSIQLQLGDTELAELAEKDFEKWAKETRLWAKIRTMQHAKISDGEAFAMFVTNRRLVGEIKLDIRVLECDMIEGWLGNVLRDDEIDGIKFDAFQNPIAYRLLKVHPGDHRSISTGAGEWIPRKFMMHYFRADRPGQVRGISEIISGLSLFGQLRRFTAAVIEAASRAAEISAIMQTDLVPESVAAELADPVTVLDVERNSILSLPEGWKLSQLKAEQPTTTYSEFKRQIINEAGRSLNMPLNVAMCDSSGYNYASGRLDHQTYDRSINIERQDLADAVLDRIYDEWLAEYAARKSLGRDQVAEISDHTWNFSGRDHVDPAKEASADDKRFANGSLTKSAYYAKRGQDWKREEKQRIRELVTQELEWNAAREAAGLPPAPYPGLANQKAPEQATTEDIEDAIEENDNAKAK
jgi:capsid protein